MVGRPWQGQPGQPASLRFSSQCRSRSCCLNSDRDRRSPKHCCFILTNASWSLSRDHHYQLSNRFAWAWKLASLGVPVVLVYLGFLGAEEMHDVGTPFQTTDDWAGTLMRHAAGTVPDSCWERQLFHGDVSMRAVVRSWKQPFPPP